MNANERDLALQVLGQADWLRDCPDVLPELLVNEGRVIHRNVGEWAQAEGDERNGLFIVIEGLLHSYCAAPGDRSVLIGIVGPGTVLGHATRYSGGPRLVTAVCVEPSQLLEISESALEKVASHCPDVWRAIAGFAYAHTRNALRMAAEVISLRPHQRIAARLVAMVENEQAAGETTLKVSQELLGEMMGLTRKTVNAHLSRFERSRLIRVGYGMVTVLDASRLRQIANG